MSITTAQGSRGREVGLMTALQVDLWSTRTRSPRSFCTGERGRDEAQGGTVGGR